MIISPSTENPYCMLSKTQHCPSSNHLLSLHSTNSQVFHWICTQSQKCDEQRGGKSKRSKAPIQQRPANLWNTEAWEHELRLPQKRIRLPNWICLCLLWPIIHIWPLHWIHFYGSLVNKIQNYCIWVVVKNHGNFRYIKMVDFDATLSNSLEEQDISLRDNPG